MIALAAVLLAELADVMWRRAHDLLESTAAREARAFQQHYPDALPRRR